MYSVVTSFDIILHLFLFLLLKYANTESSNFQLRFQWVFITFCGVACNPNAQKYQ